MKNVVKAFYILAIIVTSICGALARSDSTEISQNPYFYEVTYNSHTSYLLGTFHLGVGLENLPKVVYSKLSQMPRVFVEQISGDAKSVHRVLTDSTKAFRDGLKARNRSEGLNKSPLSQNQADNFIAIGLPREIASLLQCDDGDDYELSLLYPQWAFPKMLALDLQILEVSYNQGHEIIELDNPGVRERAHQIGEPPQAQSDVNVCALTKLADSIDFSTITNSFHTRRANYLKGFLEEEDDLGVIYRNKIWIKALIPFLKRGGNFIAVGSGHLIEPTGNLIDLLRTNGFSVRRIAGEPEK